MLADSETKPGDRAGDGSANRGPFIIGVAGGTASGKVGIRIPLLRVCLSGVQPVWCPVCDKWTLILGDNLKIGKEKIYIKMRYLTTGMESQRAALGSV